MIDDVKQFLHTPKPDAVKSVPVKHPTGWEPGVDTAKGVVVTAPSESADTPNDWAAILEEFRLAPDKWQVDSDSVNVRTWDTNVGGGEIRRLFYFKADVSPRDSQGTYDLEPLMKMIGKHRFTRPAVREGDALVVCLADWQTGGSKPDRFVQHMLETKNRVTRHMKDVVPSRLYVVGMGDMIESCDGHYVMQTFQTGASGLNGRRDQEKLARRLLVDLLQEWSRHVPEVVVGCVPGNHGENRKGGKAFTTFEDNADLSVFEQVQDVFAANEGTYGHIRFVIPDGDMSLTLDIAGTVVTFLHGHQARKGGGTPQQKLALWWKNKGHDGHPAGDAQVLVSGHYHHLQVVQDGGKTWFQCPAVANSRWWVESGGASTVWGTLTFTVGDGWDRLRVL